MTGKYLTDYEKGQIQGMRDCGIGVTQIARTMKRNISTIMRQVKKSEICLLVTALLLNQKQAGPEKSMHMDY